LMREIKNIEDDYKFVKSESEKYIEINENIKTIEKLMKEKTNSSCYMKNSTEAIVSILERNNFIEKIENKWKITENGFIASNIQEAHSLALSDLYIYTDGFKKYSPEEIAAIFSCFTNVSVSDDLKLHNPSSSLKHYKLEEAGNYLREMYNKYYDEEVRFFVNTGTDYNLHFQIMDEVYKWCNASDEVECIEVINTIKQTHKIFLGEFIKSILKINNISSEFEKICEEIGNIELLSKMREIPKLTLKYVVTNLSLYV